MQYINNIQLKHCPFLVVRTALVLLLHNQICYWHLNDDAIMRQISPEKLILVGGYDILLDGESISQILVLANNLLFPLLMIAAPHIIIHNLE